MNNLSPSVLSDVLVMLADLDDARILPRRTVSIAIDRVLAWSWNPGRLLCHPHRGDGSRQHHRRATGLEGEIARENHRFQKLSGAMNLRLKENRATPKGSPAGQK